MAYLLAYYRGNIIIGVLTQHVYIQHIWIDGRTEGGGWGGGVSGESGAKRENLGSLAMNDFQTMAIDRRGGVEGESGSRSGHKDD